MDDYTDYHRYSWSVVKPPKKPILILLTRLPWYLAILTIIHFTYTSRFFKEMDTGARIFVFCLVTVITFGLIVVFDRILNNVEKSRGKQLVRYRLDRGGIHIGNRRYPHASKVHLHYPNQTVKKKALATLSYYRQTKHKD